MNFDQPHAHNSAKQLHTQPSNFESNQLNRLSDLRKNTGFNKNQSLSHVNSHAAVEQMQAKPVDIADYKTAVEFKTAALQKLVNNNGKGGYELQEALSQR